MIDSSGFPKYLPIFPCSSRSSIASRKAYFSGSVSNIIMAF